MSKNPKIDPRAMRIYCRKAVALWLIDLADKIDNGQVDAFDLKWSEDAGTPRPVGRVVQDAQFIEGPAEAPFKAKLAEPEPVQAITPESYRSVIAPGPQITPGPIVVEDLAGQLAGDLKPCDDPDCPNCKIKA